MRRLPAPLVVLAAVIALAGCSRDLGLPDRNLLAATLSASFVAPRETATLTATGGVAPYTFDFAPNGKLSGDLASLTPGTGAAAATATYRAGELGQAQDTLVVADATGKRVEAQITVGARLAISPPVAATAPGGHLTFVASGGKPPYTFVLRPAIGSGSTLVGGAYVAGSLGGVAEEVEVTDATNDPAASATAQVSVGGALVIYPKTASVAPRETLGFVALGGQPPYAFSLDPASASGGSVAPSVDAVAGAYAAGANDATPGTKSDVVVVSDANGKEARATVTVGLPLALQALTFSVRPGIPVTVSASGGKPPYRFAFQPRGNHSRGSVDASSGTYVPGPNNGAWDYLQVTDSTGAVRLADQPFVVGPYRIALPGGAFRALGGDLDGDGAQDLVFDDAFQAQLFVSTEIATPYERTERYRLNWSMYNSGQPLLFDLDGDFRLDVLQLQDTQVLPLQATLGGALLERKAIPFGPGMYFPRTVEAGGFLYGFDEFGALAGSCKGISRLTLSTWADALPVATCVEAVTTPRPFAVAASHLTTSPWVAWLPTDTVASGALAQSSGPFQFRYLDAVTGAITRSTTLPLPAGQRLLQANRYGYVRGIDMLVEPSITNSSAPLLVLLNDSATGQGKLWGVDAATPAEAFAPFPIASYFPAAGIAAFDDGLGRKIVASWDTRTGKVPITVVPAGGAPPFAGTPVDVGHPVNGATFVDLNYDSTPDLVTVSFSGEAADVLWGEGDGTFGRRARFDVTFPTTQGLADLDKDGATDIVASGGSANGLQVFYGAGHQFAVGPVSPLGMGVGYLAADDFDGDGVLDVLFNWAQGGIYFAKGNPDSSFAAAVPVLNPGGTQDLDVLGVLERARFGGGAPGGDLRSSFRDPVTSILQQVAIVRTGPVTARRVSVGPATGTCVYASADLDGNGVDDFVALCRVSTATTNEIALYHQLSTGAGATLAFPGTWTAWSGNPVASWLKVQGGVAGARIVAGGDGTVSFLADATTAGGGSTTTSLFRLSGTVATPFRLDRYDLGRRQIAGLLGRVTPAAAGTPLDLVSTSNDGMLRVFAWNGTAYAERQALGFGGTLIGFASPAPGAPADVLTTLDYVSVVPLVNDGSGNLQ